MQFGCTVTVYNKEIGEWLWFSSSSIEQRSNMSAYWFLFNSIVSRQLTLICRSSRISITLPFHFLIHSQSTNSVFTLPYALSCSIIFITCIAESPIWVRWYFADYFSNNHFLHGSSIQVALLRRYMILSLVQFCYQSGQSRSNCEYVIQEIRPAIDSHPTHIHNPHSIWLSLLVKMIALSNYCGNCAVQYRVPPNLTWNNTDV